MGTAFLGLAAIVAGAFLLQVSNGWLAILVPLRLGTEGYAAAVIGLVVTAHSVGFLVGCIFAPRLVRSVGHIRAFAVLAAAVSVATMAFTASVDAYLWGMLRLVTGFCSAGLFTIAESWISAQTPSQFRGRVLSLYMLSNKVALAGGQLFLAFSNTEAPAFFLVAAACYSLSLIPVATTHGTTPALPELQTLGLRKLYAIAPVGIVGAVATGLVNGAVLGVVPLYVVDIGQSPAMAAVLVAIMQTGSLVLQWPLGWLSDRYERRIVILVASSVVAAVSLAIAFIGGSWPAALYPLAVLWGGCALSIYALCLAHAGDFAEPHEMVPLASSLLLCWAAGSAAGPFMAAAAMEIVGPGGLFLYSAVIAAFLAAFVVWRMTRRAAPKPEDRDRFVGVPVMTSPATARLDPRAPQQGGPRED